LSDEERGKQKWEAFPAAGRLSEPTRAARETLPTSYFATARLLQAVDRAVLVICLGQRGLDVRWLELGLFDFESRLFDAVDLDRRYTR
jgi:hypothetical protein